MTEFKQIKAPLSEGFKIDCENCQMQFAGFEIHMEKNGAMIGEKIKICRDCAETKFEFGELK